MNKVALLGKGLNNNGWMEVAEILKKKDINYEIFNSHEKLQTEFTLGILIGYSRIIPSNFLTIPQNGFILFHSSDLPKGRGWAPIYNTIIKGNNLVQTLLYADEAVDMGNILAKAYYNLEGNEVEKELRIIDDLITLELIDLLIERILTEKPVGQQQDKSKSTWCERRKPKDSEVLTDTKLSDLIDRLRAIPDSAPAFFYYKGRKYILKIEPETFMGNEYFKNRNLKVDVFF